MKNVVLLIGILFSLSIIGCVSTKVGESATQTGDKAVTKQDEEQFILSLEKIEINIIQNPCETASIYKNKAFSSPYIVSVTDEGSAVADFVLTVSYPTERDNDIISYSTVNITTNAKGEAKFTPPKSSIAVNDVITFYPAPVSNHPDVVQMAFDKAVTASFVVKSDYTLLPGGILYVYDLNEKGQAVKNNFALLKDLRNAGVNAGNAPVADTKYLNDGSYSVYQACKNIVKGEAKFLIYGTFKYVAATDKEVTLQADIECLDMDDGKVLYKTTVTESATDVNKWAAENKCKELIAETLAKSVIYSM